MGGGEEHAGTEEVNDVPEEFDGGFRTRWVWRRWALIAVGAIVFLETMTIAPAEVSFLTRVGGATFVAGFFVGAFLCVMLLSDWRRSEGLRLKLEHARNLAKDAVLKEDL